MKKLKKDLIGQRFGRLIVKNVFGQDKNNKILWLCICDCGSEKITNTSYLINGDTRSCGCLRKETSSKTFKKYNIYDLSGEYGIGYTEEAKEFYFDLEDYDRIKNYYWNFTENGYVATKIEGTTILLHRLIMDMQDNEDTVDHKFRNKYDNRKQYLRECTMQQNSFNKGMYSHNTSGIKGVYFDEDRDKWVAQIKINSQVIYLGSYNNIDDAEKVREKAEIELFKDYRDSYKQEGDLI